MMVTVTYGGRFLLAAVFVLAGLGKFRKADAFEQAVSGYGILPSSLVAPTALWLPRLEIVCGILLGFGLFLVPAALVAISLLAAFSIAISINLARGRRFDCGCRAVGSQGEISWWLVARNLALIALAARLIVAPPTSLALWPSARGESQPTTDALAGLLTTTIGALVAYVGVAAIGVIRSGSRLQSRLDLDRGDAG